MKDSSPADAEFIDAACHDPEFISAPRLPSAANLSSRAKLPRPENHRRSSEGQSYSDVIGPYDSQFIRRSVITTRNLTSPHGRGGFTQNRWEFIGIDFYDPEIYRPPISTTRNLLVLIFLETSNLSGIQWKFDRYLSVAIFPPPLLVPRFGAGDLREMRKPHNLEIYR